MYLYFCARRCTVDNVIMRGGWLYKSLSIALLGFVAILELALGDIEINLDFYISCLSNTNSLFDYQRAFMMLVIIKVSQ